MKQRKLGNLTVPALGLGCMGMSAFYGETDLEESEATIKRTLELGIDFLDTAQIYGPLTNEELVGKAIKGKRDEYVIASKFQRNLDNTVAGDMSSTRAVSSMESPAKKRNSTIRLCCGSSCASPFRASSNATRSTLLPRIHLNASSSVSLQPPSRFTALRLRAYSTRICLISCAEMAKKCARFAKSAAPCLLKRM